MFGGRIMLNLVDASLDQMDVTPYIEVDNSPTASHNLLFTTWRTLIVVGQNKASLRTDYNASDLICP